MQENSKHCSVMLISDVSSSGVQTSHGTAGTHYSAANFQAAENDTVTCASIRNINIFTLSGNVKCLKHHNLLWRFG